MTKIHRIYLLVILMLAIFLSGCEYIPTIPNQTPVQTTTDTITIANWNVQVLGDTKWAKPEVQSKIIDVVNDYDIIFIQEIRDADGSVFSDLCSKSPGYACLVSARAGRTSSKEQYGIIYKNSITATITKDYALDPAMYTLWERPPVEVTFTIGNYTFIAYNIHISPDDVANELEHLDTVTNYRPDDSVYKYNIMWLGDFNADGSYYDEDNKNAFVSEYWATDNNQDTTVAASSNTYDRIILNSEMNKEYVSSGVYTDITSSISDHYVVWVKIKIK